MKGLFARMAERRSEKLDEKYPERIVGRLLKRPNLGWNDIPRGLLENERIARWNKVELLKGVKNLRPEHIAPYVHLGEKPRSGFTLNNLDAQNLIEVMEPFDWSPFIAKTLFLAKNIGLLQEAIVKKLRRVSITDALPIINSDKLQYGTRDIFLGKVVDATWQKSQNIADEGERERVYFGPSERGRAKHTFHDTVMEEVHLEENREKTYPDVLEAILRPVFNRVTAELKDSGALIEHPVEEIRANAERLKAVSTRVLDSKEQAELRKLGIDITKNLLTLYVRYGNTVNYGTVGDALVLCTAWFMEHRFSRFFSGIRAMPRVENYVPNTALLEKTAGVEVANVINNDFSALIKLPTVHTSHSSFRGEMPGVVSGAMREAYRLNPLCVVSKVELEEMNMGKNWVKDASIEEVVTEHFLKLIELDTKMEEFLKARDLQSASNMSS